MKQILLIIAVVMGQSILAADKKPVSKEQSAIVENAIRRSIDKPTGEITKAHLEKVMRLDLGDTKISVAGLKELAKLKQLTHLDLFTAQIIKRSCFMPLRLTIRLCQGKE